MTEHKLIEHGQRTVDSRLELDGDGNVSEEETINVGPPSGQATYSCECGEHFDNYREASEHILEEDG